MGRPSEFTQDKADTICEHLMDGKSLRWICSGDDMPDRATVCRWLAGNEEFRNQYAHAREFQADTLFDEALDYADGLKGDSDVQRDRLSVDTRKWMAGKLRPKKYGDKLDLNHSGGVKVENIKRVIHDPRDTDSTEVHPAPE